MTVSEASGRKSLNTRFLKIGAYVMFGAAALLATPLIAGALFFPSSDGLMLEFAIVGFALALGLAFKVQSEKSERNSIQIDYRAAELRLGTQRKNGAFTREKVFSFRDIEKVRVREAEKGTARLWLIVDGTDIFIDFHGADTGSVEGLASQIAAAVESARAAPLKARIQSRAHGLEASFREIKTRVQSRIVHA